MDDRPIGMFDSGFGGLTVARALIDLLPDEDLIYFGDTGRYPYGPRPLEEVPWRCWQGSCVRYEPNRWSKSSRPGAGNRLANRRASSG